MCLFRHNIYDEVGKSQCLHKFDWINIRKVNPTFLFCIHRRKLAFFAQLQLAFMHFTIINVVRLKFAGETWFFVNNIFWWILCKIYVISQNIDSYYTYQMMNVFIIYKMIDCIIEKAVYDLQKYLVTYENFWNIICTC